jgi:AcrR family transcriptional regulator
MSQLAERRQEEKDRRRDQILDAAFAMAEEHGLEIFTMDQVAKKARLSRALIYVYFKNKDDLLIGLAERAHLEMHQLFLAITKRKLSGLKMIQEMGRSYVAFAFQQPTYFNAVACFAAHETVIDEQNQNESQCMHSCELVIGVLVQTLKAGIVDGSIRKDMGAPEMTALTLWGMMYGIIQVITSKQAVLNYLGASAEKLIDNALQLGTRGLAAPAITRSTPRSNPRSSGRSKK